MSNCKKFQIFSFFIFFQSCTNNGSAQQLVITSGYSSVIQFFLLDLEADDPTLYEYGQQDVDPNLTFIDIFSDGRTIYTVHEVEDYDGQGQKSGAVSRWLKGRDVFGKPELNKVQVQRHKSWKSFSGANLCVTEIIAKSRKKDLAYKMFTF